MTLDTRQEQTLRRFETHLRRDHLSATAVDHYVGAVRRGLEAGDLIGGIRNAKSRGSAFIARSAVTRWAKWREDKALEAQVAAVPFLPHSPAKEATLEPEVRQRILLAVRKQGETIRSFLYILVLGGFRIGDIFAMRRKDLAPILESKDTHLSYAARSLIGITGWTTLGGLLSPAGWSASYAVLRRALRKVCKDAGVGYVQPEEFRRLTMAESAAKAKSDG
jgi:integrase